jgi:hypothetical protein
MGNEYHVVMNISSAQATLDKAETIVALAQIQPEIAQTLSACAVLLLAAALEQGTKSKLSYCAEVTGINENVNPSETRAGILYASSLRERMKHLPAVISDDCFRLISHNSAVRNLHRLIGVRNGLLHIEELAERRPLTDQQVLVEDKNVRVTFDIPMPKDPWSDVSKADAQNFLTAVKAYFEEVLFPESGNIKPGSIVDSVS